MDSSVGRRNGESVIEKPFGLAHRRFVEREAPAGGFRIGRARSQRRRPARPSTSAGCRARRRGRSACGPRATRPSQVSVETSGFRHHGLGRVVDARAVQVEVGRDALERARAVEHRGAEPGRMRAHAHDRQVALVPIALEKGARSSTRLHALRLIRLSCARVRTISSRPASAFVPDHDSRHGRWRLIERPRLRLRRLRHACSMSTPRSRAIAPAAGPDADRFSEIWRAQAARIHLDADARRPLRRFLDADRARARLRVRARALGRPRRCAPSCSTPISSSTPFPTPARR